MNAQVALPQLGQHILVVIDHSSGYFDALHMTISRLPKITHTFFTLLCCCPTHYWGHGGEDTPELKRYIESLRKEAEEEFNLAKRCLDRGKAMLQDAGVPPSHILTKTSTEDSLTAATMAELRQGQFSGVIVSLFQYDIVNRLHGRGITDIFRQLPQVEVWAIDTKKAIDQ